MKRIGKERIENRKKGKREERRRDAVFFHATMSAGPFSLTPTLSRWEREDVRQRIVEMARSGDR